LLVAQQLACMVFVQALRLSIDESKRVGWLFWALGQACGGGGPSRAGAALEVAAPALEVGMPRSGFAAGFGQLVGDAIKHLRRSRMRVAGRSLPRGEPVGAIARLLGQDSDSAFSTARRRARGGAPRHHVRLAAVA
jgi:AraC-like DNA-binding protein